MGTWGIGPFDNDDAGDMVSALMHKIERVVTAKKYASDDYNEARAAAQFVLLAHGSDILGGPPLFDVLRALARMRSDVEWLACWKQPKKIAAELRKEILAVFDRIRTCKGCRRNYYSTRQGKTTIQSIVAMALATKIPKSTRRKKLQKRTSKAKRRRIPKIRTRR